MPRSTIISVRGGRGRGGHMLEINVEQHDDHTMCRPVGEIDAYTVGQFREALEILERRRVEIPNSPLLTASWSF